MPKIDLMRLDLTELKELQREVNKAVATFGDRRRKDALAAVEARARELGFTISELTGGRSRRNRPLGMAKYANPNNAAETWSGKGRKPRWYIDLVDSGVDPSSLLLKGLNQGD